MTDMILSFPLAGMVEKLSGNEDKILSSMPIVRLSTGELAIVRRLGWSGEEDFQPIGLDDVREYKTEFKTSTDLQITRDDVVILIGPRYREYLSNIGRESTLELVARKTEIEGRYLIMIDNLSTYRHLLSALLEDAEKVFDEELDNVHARCISTRAKSALRLLAVNPIVKKHWYYLRTLAAARINRQANQFIKSLELSAFELKETKATIRNRVSVYLAERKNALPVESAALDLVSFTPGIKSYVDIALTEFHRVAQQEQIFDPVRVAKKLIGFLEQTDEKSLNGSFTAEVWPRLLKTVEGLNYPNAHLSVAHMLRIRTERVAELSWSMMKEERMNLLSKIPEFQDVIEAAMAVDGLIKELRLGRLTYGISEFPESTLIGNLCKYAFDHVRDSVGLSYVTLLNYGGMATIEGVEADLTLTNEFSTVGRSHRDQIEVFKHSGYYVFVSKKYLEELNRRKCDNRVTDVIQHLLTDREFAMGNRHAFPSKRNVAGRTHEVEALCWIAMEAGLGRYSFPEYELLKEIIKTAGSKIGQHKQTLRSSQFELWDEDFEMFIRGEKDIFLGGSVHARLLIDWWGTGKALYIPLICPADFKDLMQKKPWPPRNVLVLSDRLTKIKGKRQHLPECLKTLFHQLVTFIQVIAEQSSHDSASKSGMLLRDQMSNLVESRKYMREKRGCWSFVASEESMHKLLLEDNQFGEDWR